MANEHHEASKSSPKPYISIHVTNGQAFVWTVEEAQILRTTYRICAILVGSLPQAAQQNVFLGLPLQLLPEEVVLLLNKGFAKIVVENPQSTTSHGSLLDWKASIDNAGKTTVSEKQVNLSETALKKRSERQNRKLDTESSSPFVPQSTVALNKDSDASFMVQLTGTSTIQPWFTASVFETLEEARASGVWKYPTTSEEKVKCAIFEDLWSKGYYLGNGLRFGGEWLVYPGDPLRFHSHFVASVHAGSKEMIDPMDIVAHGRLGTGTKKSHLVCGWDENKGNAFYFSIEWAGFG